MMLLKLDINCRKVQLDSYLLSCTEINSNCIICLILKSETLKTAKGKHKDNAL